MVKKTVIKRAYKLWPKTDRLDEAVHFLNTEGEEGLADIHHGGTDEASRLKSFQSSGTDGMLAALSIDEQTNIRDVASEVKAAFGEAKNQAKAFDRYEDAGLDNDSKVALWSLLPSNVRSAIKREGEIRKTLLAAA